MSSELVRCLLFGLPVAAFLALVTHWSPYARLSGEDPRKTAAIQIGGGTCLFLLICLIG